MIIKRKSFSFNFEGALNGAKNGALGGSLLGLAGKSPKSGGKLALLGARIGALSGAYIGGRRDNITTTAPTTNMKNTPSLSLSTEKLKSILPPIYWRLKEIDKNQELARLRKNLPGDGDEYSDLIFFTIEDMEETFDGEKIETVIGNSNQSSFNIGYNIKGKFWFDPIGGRINNLKQYILKMFEDDLTSYKNNEYGWDKSDCEKVVKFLETYIKLLKNI